MLERMDIPVSRSALLFIHKYHMNQYKKMYLKKAKRIRDPNLPPPPTLLSQVKVIKDVQHSNESLAAMVQRQQEQIDLLKSKLNRYEYRLDQLTSYLKTAKNSK